MPGCGKTAIGRHLHDLTKRKLVDIDEEIETREGKKSPYLRRLRRSIFQESRERGAERILQGEWTCHSCRRRGGNNSRKQGYNETEQYCSLYKRELKYLDTSDRPVSKAKGTEQIYSERAGLYESWSDISVQNRDPLKAAKKITEVLKI